MKTSLTDHRSKSGDKNPLDLAASTPLFLTSSVSFSALSNVTIAKAGAVLYSSSIALPRSAQKYLPVRVRATSVAASGYGFPRPSDIDSESRAPTPRGASPGPGSRAAADLERTKRHARRNKKTAKPVAPLPNRYCINNYASFCPLTSRRFLAPAREPQHTPRYTKPRKMGSQTKEEEELTILVTGFGVRRNPFN